MLMLTGPLLELRNKAAYRDELSATFVGRDRILLLNSTQQSRANHPLEPCVEEKTHTHTHTEPNSFTANLLTTIYHIWLHVFQSVLEHIWPGFDCAFKGRRSVLTRAPSWAGRFPGIRPCKTGSISTSLLTDLQQLFYNVNEGRLTHSEVSPLFRGFPSVRWLWIRAVSKGNFCYPLHLNLALKTLKFTWNIHRSYLFINININLFQSIGLCDITQ